MRNEEFSIAVVAIVLFLRPVAMANGISDSALTRRVTRTVVEICQGKALQKDLVRWVVFATGLMPLAQLELYRLITKAVKAF